MCSFPISPENTYYVLYIALRRRLRVNLARIFRVSSLSELCSIRWVVLKSFGYWFFDHFDA